MNLKRFLTGIIGFPIVLAIFVMCNKYVIDILMAIVSIIAITEYSKCAKNKDIKIIAWLGYISSLLIAVLHVLKPEVLLLTVLSTFVLNIFILFFLVIATEMKITFKDIAYTLFGIAYIVGFMICFASLFGLEKTAWGMSGKVAIWYVFLSAWGTDTVAYLIGKHFGKHKFSKISPNKTIEGCIAGAVGSTVFGIIYTLVINYYMTLSIPILSLFIILPILSIIGQIGDFSASVIKRTFEVKDFGELFPGHGGMIDRIDSILFIAPFTYIIFMIITLI